MWKGIVGRGFAPEAFAAYVAGLSFTAWRPHFVVLHHTGAPTLAEWLAGPPPAERLQNLVHYYRDELHWSAGPHLFVAPDLVWVFTPLATSGVHSPSWNLLSWGVEMVGNYNVEALDTGPGARVAANTVTALAVLHKRLGLDPATLKFHREDPLTAHRECPGLEVDKATVIARVQSEIGNQSCRS
ncbi:MAG TPA: N-acetylmuramoyl-L-alanine amidase [Stellaceae bacterium]|nr:N-acetylmuramoyl-L-alanine amidase [Stellaceae bacterium]